jgi:hypothetical protein
MMKQKKIGVLTVIVYILLLGVSFAGSGEADNLTVIVKSNHYRILEGTRGQRIEMEGFGYLMVPGKPLLPAKNFLVGLPPGARVQSVEVRGINPVQLSGTYQISPSPQILPVADPFVNSKILKELQDEWKRNNQSVYSSDQAYPENRGKLMSSGSLRKYSYASVSFYPFSYSPLSGRLIHYDGAEIEIEYELPLSGSLEAHKVELLKWDDLADEKASRLFVNYQEIKDLYNPEGSQARVLSETYDYVIITTNELQGAITSSDFLNWKAHLGYKLRTVLVTDTEITSQPGTKLAEQIRNFLRSYYIPWGIEYVLLVGDLASVPMQLCYHSPYWHTYTPDDPYNAGGARPTDMYYADLSLPDSVSWDSDRDGFPGEYGQDNPDFSAEVYVGRIPTSDTARITYSLNKLVSFEQDTSFWKNHTLHGGAILFYTNQDSSGYPLVDGATVLDSIERGLMSGWTISHYSEREGLEPSSFPWPQLTEAAFDGDWRNNEYAIVNWAGHGSPNGAGRLLWVWDDGDGIPESDGSDVMQHIGFITTGSNLDDDHPSIVFAISCNIGYPEPNYLGNMGVDLLTKPNWGSSAGVVSATRGAAASADWLTYQGGAQSICYEFNRFMISDQMKVGEALYESKFYCNQNFGWDHEYEYMNMYVYNLYGDPALVREGIAPTIVCGDLNGDWKVEITDIVYLINYLFTSGEPPHCSNPYTLCADANGDGEVGLADVVYLINYLLVSGPAPLCSS